MALQKGFLKPTIPSSIAKYRYIVGAVIGLFLAFSLYSLQFMTREAFRWHSISDDDLWLLSDSEVSFYNLIFAFIAVIIGQSFCFVYWFDRPSRVFNLYPGRLRSIVHDQRFFNWYFLAWFSKVATTCGLLFGTAGLGGFYMISLYPHFNYLFVLIIVVMFLQVWNTLLLTFKKKAYKWMMVSILVVSTLSFGLSNIDIVDYKTLNEKIVNKRLDVKYHLRLPISKAYEIATFRYEAHMPIISIVKPRGDQDEDSGPILFVGNRKCDIAALPAEVERITVRLPQEVQDRMPVYLMVDKDTPMKYVHRVTRALALADIQFLRYIVVPPEDRYDKRYYIFQERTHLSKFNQSHFLFDYEVNLEKLEKYSNKIEIQVSSVGYKIDDLTVAQKDLAEILLLKIEDNLDYAISINFNEGLTFENYFGAISAIYQAVFSLRDEEALQKHGIDFRSLDAYYQRDARRTIMNKYPLRYIEIWEGSSNEFGYNVHPNSSLSEIEDKQR